MKRSSKFCLSDLHEITSNIEVGETKEITYEDHKYQYRVDKYTMYKDYYSIVVAGGPYNIRATTTCKKAGIRKKLKAMIKLLKHK